MSNINTAKPETPLKQKTGTVISKHLLFFARTLANYYYTKALAQNTISNLALATKEVCGPDEPLYLTPNSYPSHTTNIIMNLKSASKFKSFLKYDDNDVDDDVFEIPPQSTSDFLSEYNYDLSESSDIGISFRADDSIYFDATKKQEKPKKKMPRRSSTGGALEQLFLAAPKDEPKSKKSSSRGNNDLSVSEHGGRRLSSGRKSKGLASCGSRSSPAMRGGDFGLSSSEHTRRSRPSKSSAGSPVKDNASWDLDGSSRSKHKRRSSKTSKDLANNSWNMADMSLSSSSEHRRRSSSKNSRRKQDKSELSSASEHGRRRKKGSKELIQKFGLDGVSPPEYANEERKRSKSKSKNSMNRSSSAQKLGGKGLSSSEHTRRGRKSSNDIPDQTWDAAVNSLSSPSEHSRRRKSSKGPRRLSRPEKAPLGLSSSSEHHRTKSPKSKKKGCKKSSSSDDLRNNMVDLGDASLSSASEHWRSKTPSKGSKTLDKDDRLDLSASGHRRGTKSPRPRRESYKKRPSSSGSEHSSFSSFDNDDDF